ncbi:hypothetical protein PVAP13_9KG143870 [Panicum virgatum]|uniref:Uncharacterized protein n=1 Tax=Panicum virgatum TaxID=38727 RepID=A0A8T0NF74_PANVG|nr:hypothetical protein PVAP13_9KG143870 [Panicum virgatum]KAG2547977.1 hypothetical protein PVAP13_9KG143870 [Panicum virgatum]
MLLRSVLRESGPPLKRAYPSPPPTPPSLFHLVCRFGISLHRPPRRTRIRPPRLPLAAAAAPSSPSPPSHARHRRSTPPSPTSLATRSVSSLPQMPPQPRLCRRCRTPLRHRTGPGLIIFVSDLASSSLSSPTRTHAPPTLRLPAVPLCRPHRHPRAPPRSVHHLTPASPLKFTATPSSRHFHDESLRSEALIAAAPPLRLLLRHAAGAHTILFDSSAAPPGCSPQAPHHSKSSTTASPGRYASSAPPSAMPAATYHAHHTGVHHWLGGNSSTADSLRVHRHLTRQSRSESGSTTETVMRIGTAGRHWRCRAHARARGRRLLGDQFRSFPERCKSIIASTLSFLRCKSKQPANSNTLHSSASTPRCSDTQGTSAGLLKSNRQGSKEDDNNRRENQRYSSNLWKLY